MNTFSPQYRQQLQAAYESDIVEQITNNWQHAPLPDQPGETIPYVRINANYGTTPVVYVPGFGEGIINKAPFAAELASRGFDFILPGQNRKSILKDAAGKRQATAAQARNMEAVLAAEGLLERPLHFIAHSYGGLILESMVERAAARGDSWRSSHGLLLASAGLGEDSLPAMGRRWLKMLRSEMDKSQQDFPDTTGETGKASVKTLLANFPRTFGEVRQLAHHRLDMERLCARLGRVTIVSYAEDAMFPDEFIYEGASRAVRAGAGWLVPIDTTPRPDGICRLAKGATHDDEQLNPRRVAQAIAPFLETLDAPLATN